MSTPCLCSCPGLYMCPVRSDPGLLDSLPAEADQPALDELHHPGGALPPWGPQQFLSVRAFVLSWPGQLQHARCAVKLHVQGFYSRGGCASSWQVHRHTLDLFCSQDRPVQANTRAPPARDDPTVRLCPACLGLAIFSCSPLQSSVFPSLLDSALPRSAPRWHVRTIFRCPAGEVVGRLSSFCIRSVRTETSTSGSYWFRRVFFFCVGCF